MLEDLEFDDADAPAIGLVPPGVSWEQVRDHIKIAHHHLLIPSAGGGDYTGAYWTGTDMALVSDLGSDQEEAIEEFRAYLQEHDETQHRDAAGSFKDATGRSFVLHIADELIHHTAEAALLRDLFAGRPSP